MQKRQLWKVAIIAMYGSLFFIKSIVNFMNLYLAICVYIYYVCTQLNHNYTYTLGGLVNCLHYDFSLFRQPLISIDDATIQFQSVVMHVNTACIYNYYLQYTNMYISGKQIAAYTNGKVAITCDDWSTNVCIHEKQSIHHY